MTEGASTASPLGSEIPPDDLRRSLVVAAPDSPALRHISLAGDTYTILVSGEDSGGRYCLIDMHVPPGGGPPPHRHDFEEMFTLLEGTLEFTFRGETSALPAGSTVSIPANAPHSFKNISGEAVRMLCMCSPAGQETFFTAVGDPVGSRTAPPPRLSKNDIAERQHKALALAAQYRTEFVQP